MWPQAKPVPCRKRGRSFSLFLSMEELGHLPPLKVSYWTHVTLKLSGFTQVMWQRDGHQSRIRVHQQGQSDGCRGDSQQWPRHLPTLLPSHLVVPPSVSAGDRQSRLEPSPQERLLSTCTSGLVLFSVAEQKAQSQHPGSWALLTLRHPPLWPPQGQPVPPASP